MSGPTYHLRTIPPGSIIKRHEAVDGAHGEDAIIEWEEPDGSLHVMKVAHDPLSPAGIRVDEIVATASPDCEITMGVLPAPDPKPE